MVTVRPHGVGDAAVARALDELAEKAVGPGLLTGAVLMPSVRLASGVLTRVKHNLGRRAKGYLVVGARSVTTAPIIQDENHMHGDTDKFLYLKAVGGSLTVDLAVF